MWARLQIIFYWLRELVFPDPDELNIKSRKFNTHKFVLFLILIASVALNAFLINRVFYLVDRVQMLEDVENNCIKAEPSLIPNIPYRVPNVGN